jgi:hypothetical protein
MTTPPQPSQRAQNLRCAQIKARIPRSSRSEMPIRDQMIDQSRNREEKERIAMADRDRSNLAAHTRVAERSRKPSASRRLLRHRM